MAQRFGSIVAFGQTHLRWFAFKRSRCPSWALSSRIGVHGWYPRFIWGTLCLWGELELAKSESGFMQSSGLNLVAPLFVPANRAERFNKAAASGAEDAIAAKAEQEVRQSLQLYLRLSDGPVLVRINGMGTAWHNDDVALVSSLPIDGVVLPKAKISRPCWGWLLT